jgi:hypothetical protein
MKRVRLTDAVIFTLCVLVASGCNGQPITIEATPALQGYLVNTFVLNIAGDIPDTPAIWIAPARDPNRYQLFTTNGAEDHKAFLHAVLTSADQFAGSERWRIAEALEPEESQARISMCCRQAGGERSDPQLAIVTFGDADFHQEVDSWLAMPESAKRVTVGE